MTEEVYQPYGGALELFHSQQPRVLMDGPAGTGKSRAILEKINRVMLKYNHAKAWIGRETRASMSESILATLETKVLVGSLQSIWMGGPSRAHRETYEYPNGSKIIVGGLDRPEKTFSQEVDIVAVFEAIETRRAAIELLLRSLRNGRTKYHQLILDTNPGPQTHWLNMACEEGWIQRLLSRHTDNPYLWDRQGKAWTKAGSEYLSTLGALTGVRRDRLLLGKWVSAEGVVYDTFDPAVHVVSEVPAWVHEKETRRYRAVDFGFNDPFVCQWWAVRDDVACLYREIYHSKRIVAEHAKQIKELSGDERYECTVSDHDAEDRATLESCGISTVPAIKEIDSGIDACRTRLRVEGNGRPRILFCRGAVFETDSRLRHAGQPTSTIDEFDSYVFKPHRDGQLKDEPLDRWNHGMDAMRYMVSELDTGGYVGAAKGEGIKGTPDELRGFESDRGWSEF